VTERLFFALWPDEHLRGVLRERLAAGLEGIDAKLQRPDQWHVTLEFLGEVAAPQRAAVDRAAKCTLGTAFEIAFDRVEYWRRPQVLCLAASVTPVPLATLVADLRLQLEREGLPSDSRPFSPHVTLARKVRSARSHDLSQPIPWPADRFALVRSVTDPAGSLYEPRQWWNLRVGAA
jgi:2'-5' RNA ligase